MSMGAHVVSLVKFEDQVTVVFNHTQSTKLGMEVADVIFEFFNGIGEAVDEVRHGDLLEWTELIEVRHSERGHPTERIR